MPGAASHAHILKHSFDIGEADEVCAVLQSEMYFIGREVMMDEVETSLCESTIGDS